MSTKFRLLEKDEIDVRVGNVIKTQYKEGANLLLYKNARVDMDILDETVGAENWTRGHQEIKGNLYCNVSIYTGKEWVTKQDCGVESNTEKEKGEASDSFKRACVNWGIGRELYTSPNIFVEMETEQIERGGKKVNVLKYNPTFYVSHVDYDDKRRISELRITAVTGEKSGIVFNWERKNTDEKKQERETKRKQTENEDKMIEEQAMNYVFKSGKYAGYKISKCPIDYLERCSEKCTGTMKEMVDVVISVLKRKDTK